MLKKVLKGKRGQKGASAVEYSFLVAAIAALLVLILFAVGRAVGGSFDHTCTEINNNISPAVTQCI
ncbi:MAG TPA: Flp family type IVb pilin [Nocardioidaceae bacterium]|nr:Flp family type IVb pilin [Nocardioidaceae bacterium]